MEKPNIILITTDQQRFDTIQALGNNKIFTPHLNWILTEGIAFTRCYADCPICVPSRTTIMTGKKGYKTGITDNMDHSSVMKNNPTLPQILTQNGYQTKAVGKMHFEPPRANYGFEDMELPLDYIRLHNKNQDKALPKAHGCGECELEPVISTVHENDSITKWIVDQTIDFIETRDDTSPFFVWTSFTKPHPPFDPCMDYWMLYNTEDMPEPIYGNWSENIDTMKKGFLYQTYRFTNMYRYDINQIKAIRRAYYANITQIDYALGLLYSRLQELNLLDDSWIIFTSDHGEMLGDHHMGQKILFNEGSAHIPLLVKPPKSVYGQLSGTKVDRLAELSDITVTILNAAGIDTSQYEMDGQNLLELLDQNDDRLFYGTSENINFCVMENNIKYIITRYGGQELLFDLNNDPMEKDDLSDDQNYVDIKEHLRKKMMDYIMQYSPELVKDGRLELLPVPQSERDVKDKWFGFHSNQYKYDVLH